MKKFSVCFFVAVILSVPFYCGCNNPAKDSVPKADDQTKDVPGNPVAVTIADGRMFPVFLAGRWKANRGGWQFEFTTDGFLSSAVISMGRQDIISGQTKEVELKQDGIGIYKAGLWTAQYEPDERILTVEVVMDYIKLRMGEQLIAGATTDILSGPVSKDGTSWKADWYGYPEYIVTAPGFGKLLSHDPNDNPIDVVLFTKITEDDSK